MKIKKNPIYLDTTSEFGHVYYRRRNVRHILIEWMLALNPVDADMPEGLWIVTLKWRKSIIPGLQFREA